MVTLLTVCTAAVICSAAVLDATAPVGISPQDPRLQRIGRWKLHASGPGAGRWADFDMPGCELRLRVSGATSVSLRLQQQHPANPPKYAGFQPDYFVVLVDGIEVAGFANASFSTATVAGPPGFTTINLTSAAGRLDPTKPHTIRIFKSSECDWAESVPSPNYLTLAAVELDAGDLLADLSPLPDRRIEFVGDSMMAGYCNILWVPDIDRHKTNRSNIESFWLGWPTRLCEQLGAVCHTAAWSGYALTHSKFCNKPVAMPEVFERTLGSVDASDWDFSSWVPDAVVINLGTNDWHGVPADWSQPGVMDFIRNFTTTYQQFVARLADRYGDGVEMFLGVGPMTEGYELPVRWVIGNATQRGLKVHLLNQSNFSHGNCDHPSYQSDLAIAAAAEGQIRTALGW